MRDWFLIIVFALAFPIWVSVAKAESLGTDFPVSDELGQAVDLWLADDDASALPLLARLAQKGDRTARLFLALFERTDFGTSAYIDGLSRDALLDTFRPAKDSGLFRPSWIDLLAKGGDAFASAVRTVRLPDPALHTVTALLEAGEPGVAMTGVRYIALYGTPEERSALLALPVSLHGMRPFVLSQHLPPTVSLQGMEALREMARYGSNRTVADDDPDALAMATFLSFGHPHGTAARDNPWRSDVEAWIEKALPARPIAAFCEAHCGEEKADCGVAVLGLTSGYYMAIRFASPLESVVPHAVYAESARAKGMILRRLVKLESEVGGGYLASTEEIAEQSACVASLVADRRSR